MGKPFRIAPDLRLGIYIRDAAQCLWCKRGCAVAAHTSRDNAATVDHVQCRTYGGGHKAHNLVTACARCNSRRAALSISENAARIERLTGEPAAQILARIGRATTDDIEPFRTAARDLLAAHGGKIRLVAMALACA